MCPGFKGKHLLAVGSSLFNFYIETCTQKVRVYSGYDLGSGPCEWVGGGWGVCVSVSTCVNVWGFFLCVCVLVLVGFFL